MHHGEVVDVQRAVLAACWAAVNWRLSPTKLDLFVWHKSTGMLILVLMVVRVAWRLANVTPSLPDDMRPLEQSRKAGRSLEDESASLGLQVAASDSGAAR